MNPPRHFVWLLLAALTAGQAQQLREMEALTTISPDHVVTRWGMEDGLPSETVRAVLQTRDGYLWIGTYNGLARFDGVSFRVFDDANTPALANRLINTLHEDGAGRLWIGMDTGQIAWRENDGFHKLAMPAAWAIAPVTRMADAPGGGLLALNAAGQLLRVSGGVAGAPDNGPFSELLADAARRVWVVRFGGRIEQLDAEAGAPGGRGPQPEAGYRDAAPARRGGLWVRDGQRLRRWDEGRWVEDRGSHAWGDGKRVEIFETSDGKVLVGTLEQGLFVVDATGKAHRLNRDNGLMHNTIRCIAEDREKGLWVGTTGGGLHLLRDRVLAMVTPADHWENQPVQTVTPARDGGVWVGTLGAGIYHFDGRRFHHLPSEPRGRSVRALLEDRRGRLWIGIWGEGLLWWQHGRFGGEELPQFIPKLVYGLHEARDGAIWVSTQNGVFRLADGGHQWLATDLVQADVRCCVQTQDGSMWLGMRGGGVARLRDSDSTQFLRRDGLPYEYVTTLCADDGEDLWIGTAGGGLARYRNGAFHNFTTRHGLPSDFIGHIDARDPRNLWVASYAGVFRVDKGELERCARGEQTAVNCLVLDASDGLASLEMANGNQPAGCRTPDGRLWFATSRGLAVVEPERAAGSRILPPVVLEEIRMDGMATELIAGAANAEILVPPGTGRIEFAYSALSYGAPKRIRFRYRMDDLENDWVDAGNRRSAFYTQLPPGNYRFRVIASNPYGFWNDQGAELRIKVLPFFWQTWWFAPLCWSSAAALAGTAVVATLRRRHRSKLTAAERARLIERERARIAQDLHDDLGTSLTEIQTSSALALDPALPIPEAGEYLREINQRARQMVMALDEIVWAVNPRNDNIGTLANYFCSFAEQFLRTSQIAVRFDVGGDFPALSLSSEKRHGLFLAFKEALNNAARHSGTENMEVAIRLADGDMLVEVADHGRGMAGEAQHSGADGLANMSRRLREMGGRCEVASEPGQGTRVRFILPVSREPCPRGFTPGPGLRD